MRLLIATTAVLFTVSFFFRPEAGARILEEIPDPARLESIGGLTELDVARLRQTAVRTQRQIQGLRGELRTTRDRAGRRALQQQIQKLQLELRDHFAGSMSQRQRSELDELAHNERTQRHQLRSRVLRAPDLTPDQSGALTRLLAQTEAESRTGRGDENKDLERRFWALAGLILQPEQMIAVKERLPARYGTTTAPANFTSLPGVDASFGNRVLAAFRNFEAESTATQARLKQLNQQREANDSRDLQLIEELLETRIELLELRQASEDDLLSHLNEDQRRLYAAIPPFNRLNQQEKLTRWLTQPENLNTRQRTASNDRLRQLRREFRKLQPTLREMRTEGVDPEERGGMETLMAARSLAEPLQLKMLEICRDLALLLDEDQIQAFLTGDAERRAGRTSPNAE